MGQGIPIGALPSATLPLSGSELIILSQNGVTGKATLTNALAPGLSIANNTVLGNISGHTAAATALTASQVDTLLGLGTAAFANLGSSGAAVPILNAVNTWGGLQTFNAGITVNGPITIGTVTIGGNLSVTGTTSLGTGSTDFATVIGGVAGATIATNGGTLTLAPVGASTLVTGALAASTTMTVGTGLTVTTGGAAITGNTSVASGTFTASGGLDTFSPANANVVISPTGTGLLTINPATAGTLNNMVIGGSTPLAGTFTGLTATGAVALSPANANVVISPTGTGLVTINPATAGTLNNVVIGGGTPLAITGTTITANTAFRGTDFGSGSTTTLGFTTSAGTQFQVLNTASASRNITITGSNGGNPTVNVTAGSLAITPATVFASTISATGITNTLGETFSGTTAPITLNASAGTSGNVLTSAGAGATPTWQAAATYITWLDAPQTVGFTASANTGYCIDTKTTGAVSMTLPTTPAAGTKVLFIDCKSNFSLANLTVIRGGSDTIMGIAANMTVNTTNASSILTYDVTTTDWRLN